MERPDHEDTASLYEESEGSVAIEPDDASSHAESSNTASIWAAQRSHRRSWVWRHGDVIIDKGKRY